MLFSDEDLAITFRGEQKGCDIISTRSVFSGLETYGYDPLVIVKKCLKPIQNFF